MAIDSMKNRPVYEVRAGSVLASVWANSTTKGRRYNVTLTRLYKDGDAWKSSTSFGSTDLVDVARVAVVAEMWVNEKLDDEQRRISTTPERRSEPRPRAPGSSS